MGLETYLLYMLWFISCVDSQLISARVGSTAVLPCELSNMNSKRPYVRWRTDFQVVFETGSVKSYQGERYRGRVDVPKNALLKGICSLVLKDVSVTDAGVYYCYQLEKHSRRSFARFIRRVELEIEELEESGPNFAHPLIVSSLILCLLYLVFYIVKKRLAIEVKFSRQH